MKYLILLHGIGQDISVFSAQIFSHKSVTDLRRSALQKLFDLFHLSSGTETHNIIIASQTSIKIIIIIKYEAHRDLGAKKVSKVFAA